MSGVEERLADQQPGKDDSVEQEVMVIISDGISIEEAKKLGLLNDDEEKSPFAGDEEGREGDSTENDKGGENG